MAAVRIIFIALLSSCTVYPLLTYIQLGQQWGLPMRVASQHPQSQIFTYLAVGTLIFSYLLPKIMLNLNIRRTWTTKPTNSSQMTESQVIAVMLPTFVTEIAMREAVAVLGFILGNLTHSVEISILFSAVAIFGMIMRFPTLEKWKLRILWA